MTSVIRAQHRDDARSARRRQPFKFEDGFFAVFAFENFFGQIGDDSFNQTYLSNYGLPQFFFHTTTAYALLRHNGLDVGKRDYMGAY